MGDNKASAPDSSSSLRWTSHRKTAFALRWLVRLAPVVAATIVVFVLMQTLPEAGSLSAQLAGNAVAVLAGILVSFLVARFATRFLPMAALLRLSLVFPDEAPSRFKVAMKASSSRQLERDLVAAKSDGFVDGNRTAAEQILAMATAIGTHDRRTRGHSERVRVYSRMIGEEMGVTGDELEKLQWGALLHDMGKIHVSPAILNKPGRPDEDEWAELQTHPEEGRQLLAPLDHFLGEWASASWGHHEKWDGSGYPNGLAGNDIPLAARIVAVADAYEVMTATRAYKTPMSAEEARRELALSSGTHFDPEVVRATLALSVGRLQLAAGPMSFILGLPFATPLASLARTFARFPDLGSAATAVGAAAVSMAAVGAATAAGLVGPGSAGVDVAMAAVDQVSDERESVELSPSTTLIQPPAPSSDIEVATTIANDEPTESAAVDEDTTTTADAEVAAATQPPADDPAGTTTTVAGRAGEDNGSTTTRADVAPSSTASPGPTSSAPITTTTTSASTTLVQEAAVQPPVDAEPVIESGDVVYQSSLAANADLTRRGPHHGTGTLLMWREQTITLADELVVGQQVIAAGTTVTSYYFSYSPTENSLLAATVDVGAPVLAVVTTPSDLNATDSLGPTDVSYEGSRKLGRSDEIVAAGSAVAIKLDTAGGAMDQFRVLTVGDG